MFAKSYSKNCLLFVYHPLPEKDMGIVATGEIIID